MRRGRFRGVLFPRNLEGVGGVSGPNGTVFGTLRARIILRNKFKREPQSTEVVEYLTNGSKDTLPYTTVSAAFRAGEEVRPKFLGISTRVVTQNDILRN